MTSSDAETDSKPIIIIIIIIIIFYESCLNEGIPSPVNFFGSVDISLTHALTGISSQSRM